jgi:hypothetical protein
MAAEDPPTPPTDPPAPPADPPEPPEWTPPTKDEHEKMQRALAKANAEAKTHREAVKALQAKTEDADGKAAREAAEAAEKRYKPVAVRSAAKAAFLEAGLQSATPDRVAKLVRMLDLDALTIDDDGDVTGLEAQVKAVKSDYPELFTPADKRPPRINAGDRPPSNGKVLTTGEKIAAQVLGR